MSTVMAGTPHYVLMEGNRRIGPKVLPLPSGTECAPIYGFSNQRPYETFRRNSELALTPYPLVKVYLRSQDDESGDDLKLVIVDAAGPREPCLRAATIEAVLQAHENRTNQVTTAYRLMFDQEANAYRVDESPSRGVD